MRLSAIWVILIFRISIGVGQVTCGSVMGYALKLKVFCFGLTKQKVLSKGTCRQVDEDYKLNHGYMITLIFG